jgi:arylsulfatase A-like enzyme
MNRLLLFVLSLSLILGSSAFAAKQPKDEPSRFNIVYIISDDHDFEHLGFMGNDFVHTPSLDELAAQGTVFTTAQLPMSRCHPTLASFLSGRWPHQSGIYYNYGEKQLDPKNSLPSLLRDAGYATYVEGKFWEGDPRAMGFTHGAGKTAKTFVRKGQDDLFAFIDEIDGKQPMFIWWAPLIPHTPHNAPKKYEDIYDWSKMPVPSYIDEATDSWKKKEEKSYAMEAWLDDGISQLIAKLKAAGQLENTLFAFVIDNGWCNGLPSKGTPFEKGTRTPVFFTLPGTVPGEQRINQLISTNDIYPTLLDYAGVKIPKTAAGRSLKPLIDGEDAETDDAIYGAIYPAFATKGDNRPERDAYALTVRTPEWKYILFLQDVTQERSGKYFRIQSIETDFPTRSRGDEDLYDVKADPYERHNLATDPKQRERMDTLKAAALQWWSDTGGAPLPLEQTK